MEFSFEHFSACLKQQFRLQNGEASIELTLISVEPHAAQADGTQPTAYSLVFQGAPGARLPQSMYRFKHTDLGEFELFIVPIGEDAAGVRYEAVFA